MSLTHNRSHGLGPFLLLAMVGSCTTILGIDKDYHLVGTGGATGSSGTGMSTSSSSGTGGTPCGMGLSPCNGMCVDTMSDEAHCGDCFKPCSSGMTCQSGMCKCTGVLGLPGPPNAGPGTGLFFRLILDDWNQDGALDVAVADYGIGGKVSVLLSKNGRFVFNNSYAVGNQPFALASGKLDNSNGSNLAPDIVVSTSDGGGSVAVLLNNGTGGFMLADTIPVGVIVYQLALSDVDNDGDLDLIIGGSNNGASPLKIALNNGSAQFGAFIDMLPGNLFRRFAVGHLNNDQRPDIVMSNGNNGDVTVLLHDNTNTMAFLPPMNYPTSLGTPPTSLAIADLDGDGPLDIVATRYDNNANNVSVLLNNGNGTAFSEIMKSSGVEPFSALTSDLDGDGKQDLLVLDGDPLYGTIGVSHNNGNASFAPQEAYNAGRAPFSAALGDVNGDTKPDIAIGNHLGVDVLLNRGDGTFAHRYSVGSSPVALAAGDVIGDGNIDLVVANSGSNDVSVLPGLDGGTFNDAGTNNYNAGTTPIAVAIAEMNDGGMPDIVVANGGSNDVSVLFNIGNSFIAQAPYGVGASPTAMAVGDLDQQGTPDIVVATSTGVRVRRGADNTFTDYPLGAAISAVTLGDFDGDMKLDIAATTLTGNLVKVLLNDGGGSFSLPAKDYPTSYPYSITTGDFNNDGKLDVATAADAGVGVLINDGGADFNQEVPKGLIGTTVTGVVHLAAGDMDGDSDVDIIVTMGGHLYVLLNNGDGTFAAPLTYLTGAGAGEIAIADFNKDGRLDLAITAADTNHVNVHLNVCLP